MSSDLNENHAHKFKNIIIIILSIGLTIFILNSNYFPLYPEIGRGVPLLLVAILILLYFPSFKGVWRYIDFLIWAIIISPIAYFIFFGNEISYRVGQETTLDVVMGLMGVFAVLELTRRSMGWTMPIIILCFLAYNFLGQWIPGPLGHPGVGADRVARYAWLGYSGVFGVALTTMIQYIFPFIFLGVLLQQLGADRVFKKIALFLGKRISSGSALTAVAGSAMFGMINGGAAANVAASGTMTIPLMKKSGYKSEFSASVEAIASSAGQLVPPIMGASAFVMANLLRVPYTEIMLAAVIPVLMFYLSLTMVIILYTKKYKISSVGLMDEEKLTINSNKKNIMDFINILLPFLTVIAVLFFGYSVRLSALLGIIMALVIGAIRWDGGRLTFYSLNQVVQKAVYSSLGLFAVTSVIGIAIVSVTMTGLGQKFSEFALFISDGQLFLLLLFIMISSIILGMGLPTVGAYTIASAVAAPTLINMGINPISAHLFILYYAVMSAITPPVALASYTASGIAGTNPNQTGWMALWYSLPTYLIPFVFVIEPILLFQKSENSIIIPLFTMIIGILFMVIGIVGYIKKNISKCLRGLFILLGIITVVPDRLTSIIGVLIGLSIIIFYYVIKEDQSVIAVPEEGRAVKNSRQQRKKLSKKANEGDRGRVK